MPPSDPAAPPRQLGRAGAPGQNRELRTRGQHTLRKLLDAGITVFSAKGYHAARVDDIVKAARTSHGTFYLYFANKEELFAALVADVAEEVAGLSEELSDVTPDDAGRAALRSWLARFADLYAHYGAVIRTWTEAESSQVDVGRMGRDVLGGLAAELAGRLSGSPDIDMAVAGLAVVAMVERFNYYVLSGQVKATRDEALDTLTDVIFDGVVVAR